MSQRRAACPLRSSLLRHKFRLCEETVRMVVVVICVEAAAEVHTREKKQGLGGQMDDRLQSGSRLCPQRLGCGYGLSISFPGWLQLWGGALVGGRNTETVTCGGYLPVPAVCLSRETSRVGPWEVPAFLVPLAELGA
ncbi:unnamed protein product [Clonostachys rosea]|uniref:Uncharacterized protein n=1 Tax=Bionectria ochroleuca TaxID=29856 RepID=A0ABY6TRM7_BIOOC|nr:unnamed protein product [Clonostachys rosea]